MEHASSLAYVGIALLAAADGGAIVPGVVHIAPHRVQEAGGVHWHVEEVRLLRIQRPMLALHSTLRGFFAAAQRCTFRIVSVKHCRALIASILNDEDLKKCAAVPAPYSMEYEVYHVINIMRHSCDGDKVRSRLGSHLQEAFMEGALNAICPRGDIGLVAVCEQPPCTLPLHHTFWQNCGTVRLLSGPEMGKAIVMELCRAYNMLQSSAG